MPRCPVFITLAEGFPTILTNSQRLGGKDGNKQPFTLTVQVNLLA